MDTAMKVVIIGNGIAGVMVAAKLRQLEPEERRVQIEIYSREPYEYYSRIRLPEIFSSRLRAEDLEIYKPEWYARRRLHVYKNQEAVRLEREEKKVMLRNGTAVPYDKLVLCMGAEGFKPPVMNAHLEGVFTIREYGDADAIRRYMTEGTRHAVVVGGGLLGLEAARYLAIPRVEEVTVIEIFPRLLPKQLDDTGSRLLLRLLEGPKYSVILGAAVAAFLGERRVEGLRLVNGRKLPAETVLISAGIVPRTKLAKEAGLAVNRGVVVDERLCTSDEDIFAAGDLAEFQGIVWGIIPAALDHAPVVAANLLGQGSVVYRQTIPQNTLKVAGINLTSIGKVTFDKEDSQDYQILQSLDEQQGRYEKYVLKEGLLVGSILLGSRDNYGFVMQSIGKPIIPAEIQARLW